MTASSRFAAADIATSPRVMPTLIPLPCRLSGDTKLRGDPGPSDAKVDSAVDESERKS